MPVLKSGSAAFSLIEMLVAVAILSILASVALPFAERGKVRAQEVELKRSLRMVRIAIDEFHRDCRDGYIIKAQEGVSPNCLPTNLSFLVEGVEGGETGTQVLRYLRRIPRDPFLPPDTDIEDQWDFRGYEDDADSEFWNGTDVYDLHVTHNRIASDRTYYRDW